VAPLVLLGTGALPSGVVEAAAVSALVFGWILQIVLGGFIPGLDRPARAARDGSWFSVATINLGCASLWVAAFAPPEVGTSLTALGYALVVLGWLPALLAMLGQGTTTEATA
jgi:hypothetical protein